MKKAIIIPYMRADEHREANLQTVIKHYEPMIDGSTEVIVVEHTTTKPIHMSVDQHLIYSKGGSFNKSRLLNIGAAHTKAQILIFADGDILLPEVSFKEMFNTLEKSQAALAIRPFTAVINLNLEQTERARAKQAFPNRTNGEARKGLVFAGGIVGMTRKAFELVGGWDAGYEGWGVEDNDMAYKLLKLCQTSYIKGPAVHLYHPWAGKTYLWSRTYRKNLRRFKKLTKRM